MTEIIRVGVFDSGVGGLTVLRECQKRLPQARFFYFGDNGRAPYGSRPEGEILSFTREALARFSALGADAAVLACNTATAVCAERVRREFPFPVIGTEPAVLPAARAARSVLVLCTPRTAESARLAALIARCPECAVTVFPAPRLAAAIERYLSSGEEVDLSDHLPKGNFGAVVLGCTHYAILGKRISEYFSAPVFGSEKGVAKALFQKIVGTNIHQKPREFDGREIPLRVEFLGKFAKFNEKIYKTNICFQNF